MAGRKSFVMYTSYRAAFDHLEEKDRASLIMALFDYVEDGTVPSLSSAADMAFLFIKEQIDRDDQKFQAVCERNRKNGSKGGRPSKPTGLSENPEEPKKPEDEDEDEDEVNIELNSSMPKTSSGEASKTSQVSEIVTFYNQHRRSLPEARAVSKQRSGLIHARIEQQGIDSVREVIFKAERSDFLNGINDRAWKADLGWIMRPENFVKVLEGKYDNRQALQESARWEGLIK